MDDCLALKALADALAAVVPVMSAMAAATAMALRKVFLNSIVPPITSVFHLYSLAAQSAIAKAPGNGDQSPRELAEGPAGDRGRLAPGEQPAADHRDERHADEDQEQVRHRDAGQRGQRVEPVGPEEADRRDVPARDADDRAGECQRAGRGRGDRPAGRAAGP